MKFLKFRKLKKLAKEYKKSAEELANMRKKMCLDDEQIKGINFSFFKNAKKNNKD